MESRGGGGSDPTAPQLPRRLRRVGRSRPLFGTYRPWTETLLSAYRVGSSFGTSLDRSMYLIQSEPVPVQDLNRYRS
jgi:hypothetical protein